MSEFAASEPPSAPEPASQLTPAAEPAPAKPASAATAEPPAAAATAADWQPVSQRPERVSGESYR